MKNKTISILLFLSSITMSSCLEVGTHVVSWSEMSENTEAQGRYHLMENSGVKVYVPNEFEAKSIVDFQKIIREKYQPAQAISEINRINKLKDFEGDFAIFFDEYSNSSLTVNTVDYLEIGKQDASYFLGMMRSQMEKSVEGYPIEIEKIVSKYSGNKRNYVFKYVYKFTNTENEFETYNSGYFITKDFQTVFINLNTGFNAHFDPFALKTII